jgi:hypothetical protein
MLRKSFVTFKQFSRDCPSQQFSSGVSSSFLKSKNFELKKNTEKIAAKTPKSTQKFSKDQILNELVERVDLSNLSLEEIMRSPIQIARKLENQKIVDKHLANVHQQRKNIEKRIKNLSKHQMALQYTTIRKLNDSFDNQLHELVQKGELSKELATIFKGSVKYNPSDITNVKSYPIYPGSPRGALEEDDPKFYSDWFLNNLPPYLKRLKLEISRVLGFDDVDPEKNENESNETSERIQSYNMEGAFGSNFNMSDILFNGLKMEEENCTTQVICDKFVDLPEYFQTDIPVLPKEMPIDRHGTLTVTLEWTLMRNLAIASKAFPGMLNAINQIAKEGEQKSNEYDNSQFFKQNYYPSVFGYYYLLPEHIREHPGVITALKGIERYSSDLNLEEKYLYLNRACRMSLPPKECILIRYEDMC